jgi:hypothetical protein
VPTHGGDGEFLKGTAFNVVLCVLEPRYELIVLVDLGKKQK